MAEARSMARMSVDLRVEDLEVGRSAWRDFARAWRKSFVKGFFRTRNLVRNGMWPASTNSLAVGIGIFGASLHGDWEITRPINNCLWTVGKALYIEKDWPYNSGLVLVSTIGGFGFFVVVMYMRRWLLRLLLGYRGWMYEPPHAQSKLTRLWGVAVWMMSGYHPTTYSCQNSLPRLPLPPLNSTVSKFLDSIEPLYGKDSDEFRDFKEKSEVFKRDLGPKLQKILVLKSYWSQNWVSDWWEKYVYLSSRSPTPINSNYYALDHAKWCPTNKQISRAASVVSMFMRCKRQIDREALPPLLIRNIIPMCMVQYDRLFSTTRIPGEHCDELVKYDSSVSKHIIVQRNGIYYKVSMYDRKDQLITPQNLESQLEYIIEDADNRKKEYSEAARSLGSLTACDRTEWARNRKSYFSFGRNKESLEIMESAMFHLVLDSRSFGSWTEMGRHLMHGDGTTFWFDKSFSVLIFANGKMGLNAEHSWGDAPIMGHIGEYNLTHEAYYGGLYDSEGNVLPVTSYRQAALTPPQRLQWDLSPALEIIVKDSVKFAQKNNEDLDLMVVEHDSYGKGFIKKCKVSPDAFVQMALQLAYFKDSGGKFALTYESSMTRLYLLGRTETVRPLTREAAEFIRAMPDPKRTNAERIKLLTSACDVHQLCYRNAMNGEGFDRHLFGLYVLARGLGYESDFLRKALTLPWTLSTSQQPQQQIAGSPNTNDLRFQDMLCPGGGFGPVTDDGYGVSYMLPSDHRIYFHVSSKVSSSATDSKRFVNLLFESLADMQKIYQ